MSPLKLILITGTELRHRYVQNRIHQEFPLSMVFYEDHVYPTVEIHSKEEESAWNWFFERRQQYEAENFSSAQDLEAACQPQILRLAPDTLNSQSTLDHLEQVEPDLILLFDTSMVAEPILNRFAGKIWNLHVGLSHHYRGSSSNFWPIHDRRLDCLGATILTIDPGIDTGGILAQSPIRIGIDDNEQDLMGKTIFLGADLMLEALRRWSREPFPARPLTQRGTLFLKKDFQPSAVLKVRQWVESGEWTEAIQQFSGEGS